MTSQPHWRLRAGCIQCILRDFLIFLGTKWGHYLARGNVMLLKFHFLLLEEIIFAPWIQKPTIFMHNVQTVINVHFCLPLKKQNTGGWTMMHCQFFLNFDLCISWLTCQTFLQFIFGVLVFLYRSVWISSWPII